MPGSFDNMEPELDENWTERPAFLLFGDQSLDSHGFLAQFFRQKKQGELAKVFVRQACHAVKELVERLPAVERSRLPEFMDLRQLNERYHNSPLKHAGIDAALLTIAQLAHYLECVDPGNPPFFEFRLLTIAASVTLKSTAWISPGLTTPFSLVSARGFGRHPLFR
jgi:hypothetical protein